MEDQKDSELENRDEVKTKDVSQINKGIDHDGPTFESETVEKDGVVSAEAKSSLGSGSSGEAMAGEVTQASKEVEVSSGGGSHVPDVEEEVEKAALVYSSVVKALETKPSLEKIEEAAMPISNTNGGESSEIADSVSKGNVASHDDVNQEMPEIPRSTENQPFVAGTPQPRASWMNCCGVLDFLKGISH